MLMTAQSLRDICKEHQLYRTPSLNDKLYCNFKGFTNIACLEEYCNLKALFLEGNALDSLEGLPRLPELKCLYVQQNNIHAISCLENVEALDTLNISNNCVSKLEGLSCCKQLRTLIATHNVLSSKESVAHLAECPGLWSVDLQDNKIDDPAVLEVFKAMPELKCLYLKGNPVVSLTKNYRKSLIAALPQLAYLDDRPVFETERRCCQAWAAGGLEAERAEREACKAEEAARDRANFEAMQEIRRAGWRARRQALGLPEGDGDPALEGMSDEEWVLEEEPAELLEARQRLAAYTNRPGEEEPPELAEERRKLAASGARIEEAEWARTAEADVAEYFASVNKSRAELASYSGSRGGDDAAAQTPAADVTPQPAGDDISATYDQPAPAAAAAATNSSKQAPTAQQSSDVQLNELD